MLKDKNEKLSRSEANIKKKKENLLNKLSKQKILDFLTRNNFFLSFKN